MKSDKAGAVFVNTEGLKRSYACSLVISSFASGTTDLLTLVGAANKIIKLTSLRVNADATAAGSVPFFWYKRTAANTGGTATQPAIAQMDGATAAPSGVVNLYSANPSALGAGSVFWNDVIATPAAASTGYPMFPYHWPFAALPEMEPTLRSASDVIALNMNAFTAAGGLNLYVNVRWTEEDV